MIIGKVKKIRRGAGGFSIDYLENGTEKTLGITAEQIVELFNFYKAAQKTNQTTVNVKIVENQITASIDGRGIAEFQKVAERMQDGRAWHLEIYKEADYQAANKE